MSGAPAQVALVALVREGRVLLAHRRADKAHAPDRWDLVGGMVEPGEIPIDAAVRECGEEVGVDVGPVTEFRYSHGGDGVVFRAFLARSWSGEPRNCAPDEHDDLRWVPLGDLEGMVLANPDLAADVRAALRGSAR